MNNGAQTSFCTIGCGVFLVVVVVVGIISNFEYCIQIYFTD